MADRTTDVPAGPATDRRPAPGPAVGDPFPWRALLVADLRDQGRRRPWGSAVMAIGFVHLGFFLVCHAVYSAGVRAPWVSLVLWGGEVAAVLLTVTAVAGRGWVRESPAVGLILRVWVTFLILSFNAAMLNNMTGWAVDWFKLIWCSLASCGFATMAWLFGLRFLVPAFQMYFTSLLIFACPEWGYLIHGLSWCAALQWIGLDLRRRRARLLAGGLPTRVDPVTADSSGLAPEPATAAA